MLRRACAPPTGGSQIHCSSQGRRTVGKRKAARENAGVRAAARAVMSLPRQVPRILLD